MSVYGEFLFLENALAGYVILVITGRLCGYRASKSRVAAGSIMCGAYAFILFVDLRWITALLLKVIFSGFVILVTFRPTAKRGFFKGIAVFYLISMLMGGVTIALMHMTGAEGITGNGSTYFYGIKYLQIMAGITLTLFAGAWLAEHLAEKYRMEAVLIDVEIIIGERSFVKKAFVDTGNFLTDPVSRYPAVLVSARLGGQIQREIGPEYFSRYCVIPYRSVGRHGVLNGLRPDKIRVGDKTVEKVVLAIGNDNFSPWNRIEEYDVLLQQQFVEGRTNDVQTIGHENKSAGEGQGLCKKDNRGTV